MSVRGQRTRIISIRLSKDEYDNSKARCLAGEFRSLSDLARYALFARTIARPKDAILKTHLEQLERGWAGLTVSWKRSRDSSMMRPSHLSPKRPSQNQCRVVSFQIDWALSPPKWSARFGGCCISDTVVLVRCLEELRCRKCTIQRNPSSDLITQPGDGSLERRHRRLEVQLPN
jgi:hypothetical protein